MIQFRGRTCSNWLPRMSRRFLLIVTGALSLAIADPSGVAAQEETGENPPAAETSPEALPAPLVDPEISSRALTLRLMSLTDVELGELAEIWRGHVKETVDDMVEIQLAADEGLSDSAREDLADDYGELTERLAKLSTIVDAWAQKGGDPEAIEKYRAYRVAILLDQARTSDLQAVASGLKDWLLDLEGGLDFLLSIAIVVGSFYLLFLFARVVRRMVARRVERVPGMSKLLKNFFSAAFYWFVLAIGVMVVLSFFGVNVAPLFAVIGGASFIIGFAFQDTLGNFANGLMIMANRPFDEGDFVEIGGVEGKVKSVSMVATTIVTFDNKVIIIPNRQVWGNVISNDTATDLRRVDLVFGIGYGDDIDTAIAVLKQATSEHPKVLETPETLIVVKELGDSSVNILCGPWTETENYWEVYWDLTADVKRRFDAAGVSIPFPQRDVHIIPSNESQPAAS